jgi:CheY-like chemotaxis protein
MSIRVLIVDHHEQIRRLVRAFFLSEFGFQICGEAVDGYEAIMKAQLLKPDLIVLEVAIPPLNGVEAAPKLRKLLPKTPIILFTLHGSLLKGCDTQTVLWGIAPALSRSGDRAFLNGTWPCLGKWITISAQSPSISGKVAASMEEVPQAAPRSRSAHGIWAVRRVPLEQDDGGWCGPTALDSPYRKQKWAARWDLR